MTDFISPKVAERLKYYVYLYIDPRYNRIFYVGKGKGSRVLQLVAELLKVIAAVPEPACGIR
ncbi:MAG: hypothetical protein AVDCRST_MAG86-708 [uncultured Truepera sp.]|uniref:GIY-YIG domain-containing protein n=1 Tax=uncultured Truepera sp. TaxID=543023 RepID=A0A6J4UYT7_9DEIN|nr:MAG: hypothetical protein AVDCRST_MAG86-708 [uncultured Truepera sp.]